MAEDQSLEEKKIDAILAIFQLFEKDYNNLLDAVISMATAAKIKSSTPLIGIKAILDEKEPEPKPEPDPENYGPEPMHYPDTEKKENG